jgi:hypothetical protein
MLRRNGRTLLDPQVFNHRGIGLFPIHSPEHHNAMPLRGDWFLGRLSSKEGSDLLCHRNKHNNLANGQIFRKCHRKATTIAVTTAEVRIISSEIARGLRNPIKGRAPTRETRIRERSR